MIKPGFFKIGCIGRLGIIAASRQNLDIAKNQVIPDIQLKLGATLITTDGIALGSRNDQGRMIYFISDPDGNLIEIYESK